MGGTPTVEPSTTESSSEKGFLSALRRIFSKRPEPKETKDELVVIAKRRHFVAASILGVLSVNFLMFLRFFFPRTLFEPKTRFRIGYPADYGFGIDQRFLAAHRIWVVRDTEGLFVISAVCTHLGCTPEWKPAENKFKCPCHGSGYDSEGVNFEGPAPRPMDRAHVELDPEGEIVVDLSHLYHWPKGERSEFNDPGAMLRA